MVFATRATEKFPASAASLAEYGHMHLRSGNAAEALRTFQQALAIDQGCAEAFHGLAMVAFGAHEFTVARDYARMAVRWNAREIAYLYTLGRAQRALAQNDDAIKTFRHALTLDRGRVDVWISLGIALRARGDVDDAIDCYRRVLELSPRNWMARHNLANVLSAKGRVEEAKQHYRELLTQQPDAGEVQLEMGNVLRREGDREGARHHYLSAAGCNLRSAANWIALGAALIELGEREAGSRCLRQSVALEPANSTAHFCLADALYLHGELDAAIQSYSRALMLNENSAEALVNVGAALRERGRRAEAMLCFERAIALKPDLPEAHLNRGIVLNEFEQFALAEQAFERALSLSPDMAAALLNMGNVKRASCEYSQAWEFTRRAQTIEPDSAQVLNNLGLLAVETGNAQTGIADYMRALAIAAENARGRDNLLMAFNYMEGERVSDVFAAHQEYASVHTKGLGGDRPARVVGRSRLRVGYVSSDFRRHSVAYFAEPVLEHHDKSRLEVFCYHNHVNEDEVTQRFKGYADEWVPCIGMSDAELAQRIRADGVDILIDVNGHTAGNRLLSFAREAAPVQMTWLGYPGTTGLSSMDYRITDWQVDPAGYEAYNTERPLRLPGSYFCYRPPGEAPEVGVLPMLERGYVTFGSFNNLAKLSEATLRMWSEVLRAVSGSKLLLKTKALVDEGVRGRVLERFAREGIEAQRLELMGWEVGTEHHLQTYNRVDVALDTWPYNGATTTCEALWMGVPVVSLCGPMHASRMGLSILRSAGLGANVEQDVEGFVARCVSEARNPSRLQRFRLTARERLRQSPLLDAPEYTRAFESSLTRSVRECCGPSATD